MDVISTWKAVLGELEVSISSVYFPTWIKPLSIASIEKAGDESQLVTLLCPSAYHQTMATQRYQGQIQRSLERITGTKTELAYVVGKDPGAETAKSPSPLFDTAMPAAMPGAGHHNLNPRLTFETYVVGGSNNFAYAAAQGAAKSPGTRHNPLFIYGGVGLGKTHLMQAIGHAIYRDHPDWNIMYISAETFGSDLIASLQNKRTAAFKKKYRAPNVLLIDDIQFIAGKEYTQEEFFHTFNELYMSERQIVLTSDRPPQEIPKIEERLSSRFMGGLMVDIQSPDFETRVAILTQKCKSLNIEVPSEVVGLIAEKTTTNIRELEGALQGILTKSVPLGGEITSDMVREYFGAEHERRSQRIRPSSVINKTAQYFSFKSAELVGASRKAPLTNARHTAMYLLYKDLQLPYEQVGRLFGGRDHTTIIHAVEKIEEKIKTDPEMAKIIADIKHDL
ncbi:MAG: chromosomal replication initiator protein DnaA [Microgenomates group bacterium]